MKFLLSWLKEFIELSVPAETLAARLTAAGLEVTGLTRVDGDWLFEAEVTPNRPDLLSHLGIARETAAALGRPFRFPRWLARQMRLPLAEAAPGASAHRLPLAEAAPGASAHRLPLRGQEASPFPVTIEDPEGCRRYVLIVIEGVRVAASSPELAGRLSRLGVRAVNNVVDVTNYCLLEIGQPLHAFDLDTLAEGQVRVRRAWAGERLVTIDGGQHALAPETLVIADGQRPVALAGIMGGLGSQITQKTRRVLLESALFHPALIRRGTRATKLSSDSSYRFERGVDPEMVPLAAIRAARMIADLAGGSLRLPITDVGEREPARRRIGLRPRRAQEVLGARISAGQQRRLLEHVGCQVKGTGRGLAVVPPSWRADLRIPEDLYEELARLFGYERFPNTLPPVPRRGVSPGQTEDPWVTQEARIKGCLVSAGAQEILSYSLLSAEQISRFRAPSAVKLRNPLSAGQAYLRPGLLCGALEALSLNLRRRAASGVLLFELGHIFLPAGGGGVRERRALGILAAGTGDPDWGRRPEPRGAFHVKGMLQHLWERLGVAEISEAVGPGPEFLETPCVTFRRNGTLVAVAGSVHPHVLRNFDLPADVSAAYAEVDLEPAAGESPRPEQFQPLPKVAPVVRDLALVVSEEIQHAQVREVIEREGGPLIERVQLFDVYRGDQIPVGRKGLAFRLHFSAGDKTLTEEEVSRLHQQILKALQTELQAVLR